jgi:hypothetical protein
MQEKPSTVCRPCGNCWRRPTAANRSSPGPGVIRDPGTRRVQHQRIAELRRCALTSVANPGGKSSVCSSGSVCTG